MTEILLYPPKTIARQRRTSEDPFGRDRDFVSDLWSRGENRSVPAITQKLQNAEACVKAAKSGV